MALTPTQIRAINLQYLGIEPDPATLQDGNHYRGYTWYSTFCDYNDAKEYLVTYLEAQGRPEASIIKNIAMHAIPLTLGWQARMQSRGVILNDEAKTYFEKTLDRVTLSSDFVQEKPKRDLGTAKSEPNIQDFIREKVSDTIGNIECLIDKGEPFNLYEILLKEEFPARYASRIVDYYKPELQEFRDALVDDEVKEGYRGYTRPMLKALEAKYLAIIEDAERYGNMQKVARKPYKKRAPKLDKVLKTFKYQKECPEYKVVSIDPSKILDKEEVWLFNTKYLTLTVLRAIDRGGLKIKGTSILGYDEKNSMTKKIGRKTEETLKKLLDGGKRVANKIMSEINATQLEANNRCGENTIILKVS